MQGPIFRCLSRHNSKELEQKKWSSRDSNQHPLGMLASQVWLSSLHHNAGPSPTSELHSLCDTVAPRSLSTKGQLSTGDLCLSPDLLSDLR